MLPGEKGDRGDQQTQCPGKVAVRHLLPRLGCFDRLVGKALLGGG